MEQLLSTWSFHSGALSWFYFSYMENYKARGPEQQVDLGFPGVCVYSPAEPSVNFYGF